MIFGNRQIVNRSAVDAFGVEAVRERAQPLSHAAAASNVAKTHKLTNDEREAERKSFMRDNRMKGRIDGMRQDHGKTALALRA